MSLIPTFELGVWNAWIFIVPLIVLWILGIKFLFSKRMPEQSTSSCRKEKILSSILAFTMFGSYFYSIFVPIELETVWFYIGLFVYLVGIVLILLSMVYFAKGPIDSPVTEGIYRYSRNPMFIGFFVIYLGISIACVSWMYLLITVIFIIIVIYASPFEEAVTLERYGDAYKQYMARTAKWIGMPKG